MITKKTFLWAVLAILGAATMTSCDDVLGEWSRPTPVTPSSSDSSDSKEVPEGVVNANAKFTIDAVGTQVYFAKGNLQAKYDGSSWTWAFATNQWDYIGNAAGNNSVMENGTLSTTTGTVDLFGWVGESSTVLTGDPAKYGICKSKTEADYGNDASDKLKSDWGAKIGSGWRVLTSDEWTYLFNTRSASFLNATDNARYTKAKVNDVYGVILFPDSYTHPEGLPLPVSGSINATDANGWNNNTYDAADWSKLETAGCVFLPAAGYREETTMSEVNSNGAYRSSSLNGTDATKTCVLAFSSSDLKPAESENVKRFVGCSVRLVRVAE